MADEQVTTPAPGTTEGAVPAIDTDALMAKIDAKMKENLAAFVRTEEPKVEPPTPTNPPIVDPLGEMVRQAVDPQIRAVAARAEAAEDKADFYHEHDDAYEYKPEIEKTFNQLMKAGRAMPRADIWNYIKGRDLDKFVEKAEASKKKKLEEAAASSTLGDGAGRRPVGTSSKNPYDMNDEELDKAVANVTF